MVIEPIAYHLITYIAFFMAVAAGLILNLYLGSMNYNNVFGFILFIIFIDQFISGLLLSCYYCDCYKIAFNSIIYIMTDVNLGWMIR